MRLAVFGLLAVSMAMLSFAQSFTATLEGLVTDASGAVIPGAKVALVNEATNVSRNAVADGLGHYFFTLLRPASYPLNATATGFKTFERTGMGLELQRAARVDVQLAPGEVTTKIEVTGVAPRPDNVSATEGRVVNSQSLLDLPISASNNGQVNGARAVS